MKKVLVTGGSSFISQHIIRLLLDQNEYEVTATIRAHSNRTNILKTWQNSTKLIIEKNNLDDLESLRSLVNGKFVVIHVASPFVMTGNREEVVNPALNMTKTVLEACHSSSVTKVIFTSSSVTMSQIISKTPIDENMFSDTSNLTPYEASKVESEKYIWSYVKENNPTFKVVSLHPSAVIGPAFSEHVVSNSVKSFIIDVLNGHSFPFKTQLDILMVDVRDVAKAHILAITKGEGRYLCCAKSVPVGDIITAGKSLYNLPRAPTVHVPPLIVKGMAFFLDSNTSSFLKGHVGHGEYKFDNSKIRSELGLEFMEISESLKDTIRWCQESNLLLNK
eukprot:NODE_280_length_11906_cov_0.405268.p4 type:complete len:334 gc:universal NODE_280_length_11906_cov_0.405268:1831-2832(+)